MLKERVKQFFLAYVNNYDSSNAQIKLKIAHTLRVAQNAYTIAQKEKLSFADQQLAYVIGILHDIGRFEQIRRFQTFYDAQSIDHAKLGVTILKEEHILEDLAIDQEDQTIIICAIANHNRYHIEEGLSSREYLHCCVIRDADKCDIFQAHMMESTKAMLGCEEQELCNSKLSDEVIAQFMRKESIDSRIRQTKLDVYVSHLALLFDLHFVSSKALIRQQGYYEQMLSKYQIYDAKTQQQFQQLCMFALAYLTSSSLNRK